MAVLKTNARSHDLKAKRWTGQTKCGVHTATKESCSSISLTLSVLPSRVIEMRPIRAVHS
ncbi:hypothetical protein CCACVL1_11369 [Corchorus capsularis]|uniref:Uncharacterized protein n=1 Tax=Corchorus capsularis TaxID=210143 RepID=A0A1R3ILM1_COCAP|nr:hypothetical protein CCACVL1_11369 [Corchorus capsularis]